MKKTTEDILIAFSLHERLYFPKVKKIFKSLSKKDKRIHLHDMQQVILRPNIEDEAKNDLLELPRTNGFIKDE